MGWRSVEDVSKIILCKKLLSCVNKSLNGLLRINLYKDDGFFYDYIIEYADEYINLCEITDKNKPRYDVLLLINERLKSKYFLPSIAKVIELDGKTWFYESIPKQKAILQLDNTDLLLLWDNIEKLSREVNSITFDDDLIKQHNSFFKHISYYSEMKELLSKKAFLEHDYNLSKTYLTFADIEKTLELGRLYRNNTHFVFTGLQSFLPCHLEYVKTISVIYSSFNDNDNDIKYKLSLLNTEKLHLIVQSLKMQCKNNPSYYTINIDMLNQHFDRIQLLCKELP